MYALSICKENRYGYSISYNEVSPFHVYNLQYLPILIVTSSTSSDACPHDVSLTSNDVIVGLTSPLVVAEGSGRMGVMRLWAEGMFEQTCLHIE